MYYCGTCYKSVVQGCTRAHCPVLAHKDLESRDPLLVEREKTHGSFAKNAEVFRKLSEATGPRLQSPAQEMALGMILVKLSRLVQTPNVKDHWDDIAGYAKLGSEACDG